MWSEYQTAIFWRGLFLFIIYIFIFIDQCAITLPSYWEEVRLKNIKIQDGTYQGESYSIMKGIFNIIVSGSILIYQGEFELRQFLESPPDYFTSPWNIIDSGQMIINTIILVYSIVFLSAEYHLIQRENIIRLGAYGACLMWIKMFYWMRLFSSTAKYVNLIMCTISDLIFFMIMVLIIILTFANFFFIININAVN